MPVVNARFLPLCVLILGLFSSMVYPILLPSLSTWLLEYYQHDTWCHYVCFTVIMPKLLRTTSSVDREYKKRNHADRLQSRKPTITKTPVDGTISTVGVDTDTPGGGAC